MLLVATPQLLDPNFVQTVVLLLDVDDNGPQQIRLEALPVKVRQTIQREAGAAPIESVELHEQKPTYVTEIKFGKRKYRLEVNAEGLLLNKEYAGEDDGN